MNLHLCHIIVAVTIAVCSGTGLSRDLRLAAVKLYVEDSPATSELVEQAQRLRQQNRLAEAARAYQKIIEQYPYKLVPLEEGLYTSAARWVRRQIRADPSLLAAYRQSYEPIARRKLVEAKQVPADLEGVVAKFSLCQAGLDAALHVTGQYLEQGSITDAAGVLDEVGGHPDLPAAMGRYHLLQAAVGLLGGDSSRHKRHRTGLEELDDSQRIAQLETWASNMRPPAGTLINPEADWPFNVSMPEPFGKRLWTRKLRTVPEAAANLPQGGNRALRSLVYRNLEPVADGDLLFVVVGDSVLALDRYSGQVRWRHRTPDSASSGTIRRFRPTKWSTSGGVAAAGTRVWAVIAKTRRNPRSRVNTALVCLDRRTGRLIWQVEPADLDEALRMGFFQGTPVPFGGRVYLAARRVQQRLEDAFVLAVDGKDGRLLWRRHLVTAANPSHIQVQLIRTDRRTQMLVRGGRLYVSDTANVALCLDGRTGSVVWLSQLAGGLPLAIGRLGWSAPIQSGPPILVGAGMVVPNFYPGTVPRLLDLQTGRKKRDLTGPGWVGASYFLPAGPHVIAVGPTVRLVDGRTLKILKECPLPAHWSDMDPSAAVMIRNRLLVPSGPELIEIDLDRFKIVGNHPLASAGNLLPLDDQIVVASPDALHSYMNWPKVYERLKREMLVNRLDPRPALALAHLAHSAGQLDKVIEGADAALAALGRREENGPADLTELSGQEPDRVQREVFRQLLWFVQGQPKMDASVRGVLFDRLAAVATVPSDVVTYQLARGEFLEEMGKPHDAIEHYQFILMDHALSSQLYERPNGSRRASLEVELRQAALIRRHPTVYERYDAMAALRLDQLLADPHASPDELLNITKQFPLSRVALEAMLVATEKLNVLGDVDGASRLLRRAYATTRDPTLIGRIVGRLVQLHLDHEQPNQAQRWLTAVKLKYPGLRPLRNGESIDVNRWLAQIGRAANIDAQLPRLSLPLADPVVLRGQIMRPTAQPMWCPQPDRQLLRDGDTLRLCYGPQLDAIWSVRINSSNTIELLALMPQQIILIDHSNWQLMSLEADTGRIRWSGRNVEAMLVEDSTSELNPDQHEKGIGLVNVVERRDRQGPRRQARAGRQLGKSSGLRGGRFVNINDQIICVAESSGRVIGLNRDTGRQLWRFDCDVDRLTVCTLNDESLVLGGRRRETNPRSHADAGTMHVLDPMTGQERFGKIYSDHQPNWLGFHIDGTFICATANQVAGYRSTNGQLKWSETQGTRSITSRGYIANGKLLMAESSGSWILVDLVEGTLVKRLTIPSTDTDPVLNATWADGVWHLMSRQQAMAIDERGHSLWRDAIFRPMKNFVAQFVSHRFVVLISRIIPGDMNSEGRPGIGPFTYRLFFLDRIQGEIVEEFDLGPLEKPLDPIRSTMTSDHLLLTTTDSTLIISGLPNESGPL